MSVNQSISNHDLGQRKPSLGQAASPHRRDTDAIRSRAVFELLREREWLNRDLELARQVQKRLVPQSVPAIPGFEFFAHYAPAREIGGDYYDFVPLPHGRLAIAVGDVSGNGFAAAVMMARFSAETRHLILSENSLPAVAIELNHRVCTIGAEEIFITLSLCVLDLARRTMSLTSAGHPPVLVRRKSGTVDRIDGDVAGFPLGIIPGADYGQLEVELHAGDVVAVFSDGVTDGRNLRDELYDSHDSRRLHRKLAETSGGPVAMGRAILEDIHGFSSHHVQTDDVTLICFGPLDPL
jgi:serine phosphatase RsbU (regulator of sigma subunit)